MSKVNCPGAQHLRQPKPEIFECPFCGSEVEIWTDEFKGTCLSCKKKLFRDPSLNCIEWCQAARECVGEEAYNRLTRKKGGDTPEGSG